MAGGEVSTHGAMRGAGRFGLTGLAFQRQVNNAMARGMKREKFYGPVRKYLDHLWRKGCDTQSATDIRVYNDNIFLFAGSVLVTAWPVPYGLKKNVQEQWLSSCPKDAFVSSEGDGG